MMGLFVNGLCASFVFLYAWACFHSAVLMRFHSGQATKEEHSEENQIGALFQKIINDPVIPAVDEALSLFMFTPVTASTSISLLPHCPPTFAFSVCSLPNWSQIWRLLPVGSPASFLTSFCFSMDVQGDYDPCDASGFIRINAVRLAFALKPKNDCFY